MSKSKNKILTELPRYTEGTYKGRVNYQVMEGMDLELLYNDEVYSVKIVEYVKHTKDNDSKFKIKYKNNINEICCGHFINSCSFGGILTEWKVIEGDNKNKILSNVPFKGNKVHYKSMKGLNLKLLYKNKIYDVEVVDYINNGKSPKFKIKYNDNSQIILCSSFMRGRFGSILGEITKDFKFNIGDNLKDEKRDITIIGREYRQRIHTDGKSIINDKWYKYKCNKCKYIDGTFYEGWILESNLIKGQGCNYCHTELLF